jgi:hypothetical protein
MYHNPNTLYVWCFVHCLNLAVIDVCETTVEVQDFFCQELSIFSTIKRTAQYVFLQKSIYPKECI